MLMVGLSSQMTTQDKSSNKSAALVLLFRQISESYNFSELNTVCMKLGVEIEDLSGTNKSDKIRELIKYAVRHDILENLLEILGADRPHISWPIIEDFPPDTPFPFIKDITDLRGCYFQFGSFKFSLLFLFPLLILTAGLFSSSGLPNPFISTPLPTYIIAECSVPIVNLNIPQNIDPGQAIIFNASDADQYVYKWGSSAGEFESIDTSKAVYIAPSDEGPVLISITTTDSCGREVVKEFTIRVESQPTIASVVIPPTIFSDTDPSFTPTPTKYSPPSTQPPIYTGIVSQTAPLLSAPSIESSVISVLDPPETIKVFARWKDSDWLYIGGENQIEGWVEARNLILYFDIASLPSMGYVAAPPATPISASTSSGKLTINFWDLPGNASCLEGNWTITLYLEAQGGDPPYDYYINNQLIAANTDGAITKQFSGSSFPDFIQYYAIVLSSSEEAETQTIFVQPPICR